MLTRADCHFYQSVELPGGEVIDGPWDLRGRELEYLGGIDLAGRRVLELGPATGALTYFMEREGADVVSFDVGYDVSIDLYPAPGNADTRKLRLDHARKTSEVQNSWWYLHRAYGSIGADGLRRLLRACPATSASTTCRCSRRRSCTFAARSPRSKRPRAARARRSS